MNKEKLKVKDSIVICTVDESHKLVLITKKHRKEYNEPTAVGTLLKIYGEVYRAICRDLLGDKQFTCTSCKTLNYMRNFAGAVLDENGVPEPLCLGCVSQLNRPIQLAKA